MVEAAGRTREAGALMAVGIAHPHGRDLISAAADGSGRRAVLAGMAACGLNALLPGGARSAVMPSKPTLFGVNSYDLFYNYFRNSATSRDPARRLEAMAKQGIPFVRFSASPFWPNEWDIYDSNPEAAMKRLDRIVASAETLGIKLIPTLIWHPAGLSDHFGEPVSAWGDPASRARTFARRYYAQIVSRHVGSPAIMAWEASNEFNAFAGREQSERFFPPVNVRAGTPDRRSPKDRFSWADVEGHYEEFGRIVRSIDPGRPISTGANIPRSHMMNNLLRVPSPDSPKQFAQALQLSLAGRADILSLHIYPDSASGRFGEQGPSYSQILGVARQVAVAHKARLLVGEFGVKTSENPRKDKAEFSDQVRAMSMAGVDYAALWVYDCDFMPGWTVTRSNDRSWQWAMLREANA